jgi:hypothetical protein
MRIVHQASTTPIVNRKTIMFIVHKNRPSAVNHGYRPSASDSPSSIRRSSRQGLGTEARTGAATGVWPKTTSPRRTNEPPSAAGRAAPACESARQARSPDAASCSTHTRKVVGMVRTAHGGTLPRRGEQAARLPARPSHALHEMVAGQRRWRGAHDAFRASRHPDSPTNSMTSSSVP